MITGMLSAFSQAPYKNSIGGIAGFIDGGSYKTFVSDNFAIQVDFGLRWAHYGAGVHVNGNFMYEQPIKNGFHWFVGGGVSAGPTFGLLIPIGFNFGLNSIGGAEYKFKNIPLTLQADIRPGATFLIYSGGFPLYFDYNFVNASVRYTFK
jgi:hypothetical protein